MKKFICYIGCCFLLFNLFVVAARADVLVRSAHSAEGGETYVDKIEKKIKVVDGLTQNENAINVLKVAPTNIDKKSDTAFSQNNLAVEPVSDNETNSVSDNEANSVSDNETNSDSETLAQHIHNEIAKLFLLPFVADKIYQGDKIYGDLSGVILTFYPSAQQDDIENLTDGIRFFVKWKRKYEYVVQKLKHQIKAAKMLPKDAPIVAQEGEYAPAETDLTKQSGKDEYFVSYKPYKYLEYDAGEFGEPVRRMDKNYVTTDEVTYAELLLALLQLDMPAFLKAWQNIPASTDGAAERFQSFTENGEIRLLADSSLLGEQKKIRAAFDILVPDGFYINGDVLNPQNKLGFILSETELKTDKGTVYRPSKNVSSYQIYQPLADGIQDKNQQTHRVLTGRVRIPVEFERADTDKSMRISGALRFVLCATDGNCKPIVSYHELTLRQGTPAEASVFENYITQGFMKYPHAQSKHVQVKDVAYNADKSQLMITFEGTTDISNMAVMVEDAYGTNFINPRYEMKQSGGKWVGKAYFDLRVPQLSATAPQISDSGTALVETESSIVANETNFSLSTENFQSPQMATDTETESQEIQLQKSANSAVAQIDDYSTSLPNVAISASFDNYEFLRTIIRPHLIDEVVSLTTPVELKWWMLLGFGFLLNLMPAVMMLCFNLMTLIWQKNEQWRIFVRYALTSALGLAFIALGAEYWAKPEIYCQPLVLVGVGGIAISLMMEHLGYVDFALFRPLRKWIKYGVFTALFSLLLLLFLPMPYKTEIFDVLGRQADTLSLGYQFTAWGLIWLGMMLLPLSAFVFAPRSTYFIWFFERINLFYTPLLLGWLLWICGVVYSLGAALLMLGFLIFLAVLWYWFPVAIGETIKHSRSSTVQAELFFKVQRHWLLMLVFLMVLAVGGLHILRPTASTTASESVLASVNQVEKRSFKQPLLLTVGAPYSPRSLMNLRVLNTLKDAGLSVVKIDVLENPNEALYWFQRYQHFYPPFAVLFTERHPYGLVLPQDLKSVNFNKALSGW